MIVLEIRSTVKVTVIPKRYEKLSYSKMHPHTKSEMPISNYIGDIARTSVTDGQTDDNEQKNRGLII